MVQMFKGTVRERGRPPKGPTTESPEDHGGGNRDVSSEVPFSKSLDDAMFWSVFTGTTETAAFCPLGYLTQEFYIDMGV